MSAYSDVPYKYRAFLRANGETDFTKFDLTDDPKNPDENGYFPIICYLWNYENITMPDSVALDSISEEDIQFEKDAITNTLKNERQTQLETQISKDVVVKMIKKLCECENISMDFMSLCSSTLNEILEEEFPSSPPV